MEDRNTCYQSESELANKMFIIHINRKGTQENHYSTSEMLIERVHSKEKKNIHNVTAENGILANYRKLEELSHQISSPEAEIFW